MKKITLAALFATILAFTANAQKSGFGIKGGTVISNIEINDVNVNLDPRVSGYIGVAYTIKATDHWSFQPEILFTPQGCELKRKIMGNDVSVKMNLNYIQIPVIVKYNFNSRWALEFGPQMQILASSELKAEALGQSESTNTDDAFNTLDFGFSLGTSFHFTEKLFMDLRVNASGTNINEDKDEVKAYNRSFQLGIGYTF